MAGPRHLDSFACRRRLWVFVQTLGAGASGDGPQRTEAGAGVTEACMRDARTKTELADGEHVARLKTAAEMGFVGVRGVMRGRKRGAVRSGCQDKAGVSA